MISYENLGNMMEKSCSSSTVNPLHFIQLIKIFLFTILSIRIKLIRSMEITCISKHNVENNIRNWYPGTKLVQWNSWILNRLSVGENSLKWRILLSYLCNNLFHPIIDHVVSTTAPWYTTPLFRAHSDRGTKLKIIT